MPLKRKITRAEADAQIVELAAAARDADKARFEQQLALGALVVQLQLVYELCDGLEDDRPIRDVIEHDFEIDVSRGYQLAQFRRVDEVLRKAKTDRLVRESHARIVAPLLSDPKLLKRVVRRGQAIAREEGKALIARHLEAARKELAPASYKPQEARAAEGDGGAAAEIRTQEAPPQDLLAAVHAPGPVEGPWPYSPEAAEAFAKVQEVDRSAVLESLAAAALIEEVTPQGVAEAAYYARTERVADGGQAHRPVVVGVAVALVEANRRLLKRKPLHDLLDRLIADIDVLPEDYEPQDDGVAPAGPSASGSGPRPLLVVVPTTICPDGLLDAHPGARGRAAGRAEVIVELQELCDHGGPVEVVHGRPVLDVEAVRQAAREAGITKRLHKAGPGIEWAAWALNPCTGCSHGCRRKFCYASDWALRHFPQCFVPTIHPARLDALREPAPDPGRYPEHRREWSNTIFLGSMTDVLNRSFPDWWLDALLAEIRANTQWRVYLLTKLSRRVVEVGRREVVDGDGDTVQFTWPPNVYLGVTVTTPSEVEAAALALASVRGAAGTWVSAEPYLEPYDPTPLLDAGASFFPIGAQTKTRWAEEKQPDPADVLAFIRIVCARGAWPFPKSNLDWRGEVGRLGWPALAWQDDGARKGESSSNSTDVPEAAADRPPARAAVPARGPKGARVARVAQ